MNNDIPFFSVVIPLFNKEAFIEETLTSVLNQDFNNFEIIIVDDGSSDNSVEIVSVICKNDSRISLHRQQNKGVSSARNKGIEIAKGEYIAFLDADDYWYPNHLLNFKLSIDKFSNHAVFCNNYKIEIAVGAFKEPQYTHLPKILKSDIVVIDNYFKCSLKNSIAWTSAVCLKRKVAKAFLFDETMKSGQDTDLWIRLGIKLAFIFNNNASAIHKKYIENSLSKSKSITDRLAITEKYIEQEKNDPFLKKFIDHNRFSLIITFKRLNNKKIVLQLKESLNSDNINKIQRVLINSPKWVLECLLSIKEISKKYYKNLTIFSA